VETPSEIHAVSVSYHCGSDNSQRTASLTDVGFPNAALYDGAYLHLDCAERVTNFQVSVQNKAIGALDVDASTDTQRPNAGKITSNVYAPKGTSATDPNWAIVLPHNGAYGALTVAIRAYLCHPWQRFFGVGGAVLCGSSDADVQWAAGLRRLCRNPAGGLRRCGTAGRQGDVDVRK